MNINGDDDEWNQPGFVLPAPPAPPVQISRSEELQLIDFKLDGIKYKLAYFNNNNYSLSVSKILSQNIHIEIPDFINSDKIPNIINIEPNTNLIIKEISKNACKTNMLVNTVRFPANLEKIHNSAFEQCTGLDNLELPANLKSIGINAFKNCFSLHIFELPANLESIGKDAFEGCSEEIQNMVQLFLTGNNGKNKIFKIEKNEKTPEYKEDENENKNLFHEILSSETLLSKWKEHRPDLYKGYVTMCNLMHGYDKNEFYSLTSSLIKVNCESKTRGETLNLDDPGINNIFIILKKYLSLDSNKNINRYPYIKMGQAIDAGGPSKELCTSIGNFLKNNYMTKLIVNKKICDIRNSKSAESAESAESVESSNNDSSNNKFVFNTDKLNDEEQSDAKPINLTKISINNLSNILYFFMFTMSPFCKDKNLSLGIYFSDFTLMMIFNMFEKIGNKIKLSDLFKNIIIPQIPGYFEINESETDETLCESSFFRAKAYYPYREEGEEPNKKKINPEQRTTKQIELDKVLEEYIGIMTSLDEELFQEDLKNEIQNIKSISDKICLDINFLSTIKKLLVDITTIEDKEDTKKNQIVQNLLKLKKFYTSNNIDEKSESQILIDKISEFEKDNSENPKNNEYCIPEDLKSFLKKFIVFIESFSNTTKPILDSKEYSKEYIKSVYDNEIKKFSENCFKYPLKEFIEKISLFLCIDDKIDYDDVDTVKSFCEKIIERLKILENLGEQIKEKLKNSLKINDDPYNVELSLYDLSKLIQADIKIDTNKLKMIFKYNKNYKEEKEIIDEYIGKDLNEILEEIKSLFTIRPNDPNNLFNDKVFEEELKEKLKERLKQNLRNNREKDGSQIMEYIIKKIKEKEKLNNSYNQSNNQSNNKKQKIEKYDDKFFINLDLILNNNNNYNEKKIRHFIRYITGSVVFPSKIIINFQENTNTEIKASTCFNTLYLLTKTGYENHELYKNTTRLPYKEYLFKLINNEINFEGYTSSGGGRINKRTIKAKQTMNKNKRTIIIKKNTMNKKKRTIIIKKHTIHKKTQKHKNTKTQKHKNTKTQKHKI